MMRTRLRRKKLMLQNSVGGGHHTPCRAMVGGHQGDRKAERSREKAENLYWGFHGKGQAGQSKQFRIGKFEEFPWSRGCRGGL